MTVTKRTTTTRTRTVATRTTTHREARHRRSTPKTKRLQAPVESTIITTTTTTITTAVAAAVAVAASRTANTAATGRHSRRFSFTSWRELSRSRTIRTCTRERSSPSRSTSPRFEFKSGSRIDAQSGADKRRPNSRVHHLRVEAALRRVVTAQWRLASRRPRPRLARIYYQSSFHSLLSHGKVLIM